MPFKDIDDRRSYQREYQTQWRREHPKEWGHIRKAHNRRKIERLGLEEFRRLNAEKGRLWRAKNPQRAKELQERYRGRYSAATSQYRRWKKYGITHEQFLERLRLQEGRCRICLKPFANHRQVKVDHCHTTKRVRGLLCSTCNSGLGHFKDREDLLMKASEYLIATRAE
jgi:hypothetical protein